MIITGSEKAFAAGADIGAMATYSFADAYKGDYITRNWETIRSIRKPVIAAVSGFALGGGCELAMMCDFIIAADNAKFGQPEIKLGIIPGAGGTQRLPRAVGKAKAMDMALTGRMMDAAEAERAGLVSRVVPLDKLMDEALGAALMISDFSQPAVMAAKESVNRAFEGTLADGVMFERRLFHALFATARPEGRHGRLREQARLQRPGPHQAPEEKGREDWRGRLRGQPGRRRDHQARALCGRGVWPANPAPPARDAEPARALDKPAGGHQLPRDRKVRPPAARARRGRHRPLCPSWKAAANTAATAWCPTPAAKK
jgi:enoyl-CoA hydratase